MNVHYRRLIFVVLPYRFVVSVAFKNGNHVVWKLRNGEFDSYHQSDAGCFYKTWGTDDDWFAPNCCGWWTISREIVSLRKFRWKVSTTKNIFELWLESYWFHVMWCWFHCFKIKEESFKAINSLSFYTQKIRPLRAHLLSWFGQLTIIDRNRERESVQCFHCLHDFHKFTSFI